MTGEPTPALAASHDDKQLPRQHPGQRTLRLRSPSLSLAEVAAMVSASYGAAGTVSPAELAAAAAHSTGRYDLVFVVLTVVLFAALADWYRSSAGSRTRVPPGSNCRIYSLARTSRRARTL
jgi:hypothetical protein